MLLNPAKILATRILNGGTPQQNGVDLHVKEIYEIIGSSIIDRDGKMLQRPEYIRLEGESWNLNPNIAYVVDFEEEVNIPENIAAFIIHRSSLNRVGVSVMSGLYDSGFHNQCGAILRTNNTITIEKGARLAQIVFFEAESATLYNGQYQG